MEQASANDTLKVGKLPPRQILADSVYETVKGLLMDQSIKPESRINIDKLAWELQVSPTPVREALARLESEGLVTKEPMRGYSAAPLLNLSTFLQLFEMRLLLEPVVARKAATAIREEDLLALEQQVLAIQEVKVGQTYQEYRQIAVADAMFHNILAKACGNVFFQETLERLRAHLHLYRLYFYTGIAPVTTVEATITVAEHRAIIDALRQRDTEAAATAMAWHIEQAQRRLLHGFETRLNRT